MRGRCCLQRCGRSWRCRAEDLVGPGRDRGQGCAVIRMSNALPQAEAHPRSRTQRIGHVHVTCCELHRMEDGEQADIHQSRPSLFAKDCTTKVSKRPDTQSRPLATHGHIEAIAKVVQKKEIGRLRVVAAQGKRNWGVAR